MDTLVDLYTTANLNDNNPQKFRYSLSFNGLELMQVVSYNLRQQINYNLTLKFITKDGENADVELLKTLDQQGIKDSIIVFLLPKEFNEKLSESQAFLAAQELINAEKRQQEEFLNTQTARGNLETRNISVSIDANFVDFDNPEVAEAENISEALVQVKCIEKFEPNGLEPCNFYQTMSFAQAIRAAKTHLNITKKDDYAILIQYPDYTYKFMGEANRLDFYEVTEDCIIHLFPKFLPIKISSHHFKETVFNIDITKTVADIVKEVAESKGLTISHDYTLATKEDDSLIFLKRSLEIPAQIDEIEEFILYRRYFNFSREDIINENDAITALNDTVRNLPNMKLYPTEAQVIDLIYYAFTALSSGVPLAMMPNDFSCLLPSIVYPEDARERVLKKYEKEKIPDRLNCIRLFLRTMRSVPGFGSEIFMAYLEEDENYESHREMATIIVSPVCITIASRKIKRERSVDDCFFYQISYSKIRDITAEGVRVHIEYMNGREQAKLTLKISNKSDLDLFVTYFTENTAIIRGIFAERARRRASGEKVQFTASFDRVELLTSEKYDEKNPKKFIYDKAMTGKMLIEAAMNNLNIKGNPDSYDALLFRGDDSYAWIEKDKLIGSITILDGMLIIITPSVITSRIHLSGSVKKMVRIDLKSTVNTIIQIILAKIGHPESDSFTLFSVEDKGVLKPLDDRFYITGQTNNYSEFYFRRRIFTLSQEDTISRVVRLQVVNDCQNYIMNNKTSISLDLALELAIVSRYVHARSISEVLKDGDLNLANDIPSWFKCDKKTKELYLEKLNKYDKLDSLNATKRYLKLVRNIPDFGSETFQIKYCVGNSPFVTKDIKDRTLIVNGRGICITGDKEKINIAWMDIIKLKFVYDYLLIQYGEKDKKAEKKEKISHEFCITTKDIKKKDDKRKDELKGIFIFLNQYIHYISSINKKKKMRLRNEPIQAAAHIEGTYADASGKVHPPEIDFFVGTNPNVITGLEKAWIPFRLKRDEVIATCIELLGLDQHYQYTSMIFINRKCMFMNETQTIGDLNPPRESYIFIVKKEINIVVKFENRKQEKIKCNITDLVSEISKKLAAKYNVLDPDNYSLFIITEGKNSALNPAVPIGEQTAPNSLVSFERLKFDIPPELTTNQDLITSMYNEIQRSIVSNKFVDFPVENLEKLALFNIMIEKGGPLQPSDIKDDLTPYIPQTAVFKKNEIKAMKEMTKTIKFTDKVDLMERYIKDAINMPLFSAEYFSISIKNNDTTTNCLIVVDDRNINVVACAKKNIILQVPIFRFIEFSAVNTDPKKKSLLDITLVYTNESFKSSKFYFSAFSYDKILEMIKYKRSKNHAMLAQLYRENMSDYTNDTKYITNIKTNVYPPGISQPIVKEVDFDTRYSPEQVSAKIQATFFLSSTISTSIYLSIASGETIPYPNDMFFGEAVTFGCQEIYVYETYHPIKVNAYIGNNTEMTQRSLTVDIRLPVKDIIPSIASIFNIQYWTGYELYYSKKSDDIKMLNIDKPIPVQTHDLTDLVFIRRNFCFRPSYDLKNPAFALNIFNDAFREYLLGDIELTSENLITFALYFIIVHSKDEEDYNNFVPTTFEPFLPDGIDERSFFLKSLISLKENTKFFEREIAAQKFLTELFRIKNFGTAVFKNVSSTIFNQIDHKDELLDVTIFVNYTGVKIVYQDVDKFQPGNLPNVKKREPLFLQFEEIQSIGHTKKTLVLNYILTNSRVSDFVKLKGEHITKIKKEIELYKFFLTPLIRKREAFQATHDKELEAIPQERRTLMQFSIFYNNPTIEKVVIDSGFSGEALKHFLCNFFVIEDPENYELFIQVAGANNKLLCPVQTNSLISTYNIKPNDIVFLIKTKIDFFIKCPAIATRKATLNVTKPVSNIIFDFMKENGLGFSDGFGFNITDDEGNQKVLKQNESLFTQVSSTRDIILQRRVYLYSVSSLEDPKTLKMIVIDSKRFLKSSITLTSEKAIELAAIYADCDAPHDKKESMLEKQPQFYLRYFPERYKYTLESVKLFKEAYKKQMTKNLSRNQSMDEIIREAIKFEEYGADVFNGIVKTKEGTTTQCIIVINPYVFIARDFTQNIVINITTDRITNYKLANNDILVEYSISEDETSTFTLSSDNFEDLFEFIDFIMTLIRKGTFLSTIASLELVLNEFINPTENNEEDEPEVQQKDTDYETMDMDYNDDYKSLMIKFDDFGTINVGDDSALIDPTATQEQEAADEELQYTEEIDEADFIWKMSTKALMLCRLLNTLTAAKQYIIYLINQFQAIDQQVLVLKLNQLLKIIAKDTYQFDDNIKKPLSDVITKLNAIAQYATNPSLDLQALASSLNEVISSIDIIFTDANSMVQDIQNESLSLVGLTGFTQDQKSIIKYMFDVSDLNEILTCIYHQHSNDLILLNKDIFQITSMIERENEILTETIVQFLKEHAASAFFSQASAVLNNMSQTLSEATQFNAEVEALMVPMGSENDLIYQTNDMIAHINVLMSKSISNGENENIAIMTLSAIAQTITGIKKVLSNIQFTFTEEETIIYQLSKRTIETTLVSTQQAAKSNADKDICATQYKISFALLMFSLFSRDVLSMHKELSGAKEEFDKLIIELTISSMSLTKIHITPKYINLLLSALNSLVKELDNLKKKSTQHSSELSGFTTTIGDSRYCIKIMLPNIENNPTDIKSINKIREEAIALIRTLFNLQAFINKNEAESQEYQLTLAYIESTILAVRELCTDSLLYVKLDSLPHVILFHNLQNYLFNIHLTISNEIAANESTKDVLSVLTFYLPSIKDIYLKSVDIRDILHVNSSSKKVVKLTKDFLTSTSELLNTMRTRTNYLQVSQEFKSNISGSIETCNDAIESLTRVQANEFLIQPTMEQIKATKRLFSTLISHLRNKLTSTGTQSTTINQSDINDTISYIEQYKPFLDNQEKNPTVDFFKVFKQIDASLNNLEMKIISSKANKEHQDFFNDTEDEIERITQLTLSSFEYTNSLIENAREQDSLLLNAIKDRLARIDNSNPSFEFINEINNKLFGVNSFLATQLEENEASSIICIAIKFEIIEMIETFETSITNPLFIPCQDLIIDINRLTEILGMIIHSIDNLPFIKRVFPAVSKVTEIPDPKAELPIIAAQISTLSLLSASFLTFPDLVFCPQLTVLAGDGQIQLEDYTLNEKEDFMSMVSDFCQAKDTITELCNALQPLFHIPNFRETLSTIFENTSNLHRFFDVPYINTITISILKDQIKLEREGLILRLEGEIKCKEAKESTKNYSMKIKNGIEELIATEDVKVAQKCCNNLHKMTSKLISQLFFTGQKKELVDSLITVYETCTKFVTCELEPVSFTKGLYFQNHAKLEKAANDILMNISFNDIYKEIDTTKLRPILTSACSYAPTHFAGELQKICDNIDSNNRNVRGALLRTIAVAAGVNNLIENHETIAILSTLFTLQTAYKLNCLNRIITEVIGDDTNSHEKYLFIYFNKVRSLVDESDEKLLLQTRSIDVVSNIYFKMLEINNFAHLVYHCIKRDSQLQEFIPQMKSVLLDFISEFSSFTNTLFALLFAHIYVLISTIEDMKIDNVEVGSFIKECAELMVSTRILTHIKPDVIVHLSNLVDNYETITHPIIIDYLSKKQQDTSTIEKIFEKIKQIKCLIDFWRKSHFNKDEAHIDYLVEICTTYATIITERCVQDTHSSPRDVIFDLIPIETSFDFVNQCIESAGNKKYENMLNLSNKAINGVKTTPEENLSEAVEDMKKCIGTLYSLNQSSFKQSDAQRISNEPQTILAVVQIDDDNYKNIKDSIESLINKDLLSDSSYIFEREKAPIVDLVSNTKLFCNYSEDLSFKSIKSDFNFIEKLSKAHNEMYSRMLVFGDVSRLFSCLGIIIAENQSSYQMIETKRAIVEFINKHSSQLVESIANDIWMRLQLTSTTQQIVELSADLSEEEKAILILILGFFIKKTSDSELRPLYSSILNEKAKKQLSIYQLLKANVSSQFFVPSFDAINSIRNSRNMIYSLTSQTRLLYYLTIIKQHLYMNASKAKIATNSSETLELLTKPISISDILYNQDLLKGQINIINSQDLLDMIQASFSVKIMTIQMRIIDAMFLNLTSTKNLIISSPNKQNSIFDVYTMLALNQIALVRDQNNALAINSFFNVSIIEKALKRINLNESVLETATKLLALSYNYSSAQNVKASLLSDTSKQASFVQPFIETAFTTNTIVPNSLNANEAACEIRIISGMLHFLFTASTQKILVEQDALNSYQQLVVLSQSLPAFDELVGSQAIEDTLLLFVSNALSKQFLSLVSQKELVIQCVKINDVVSTIKTLKPSCVPGVPDKKDEANKLYTTILFNELDQREIASIILQQTDSTVSGILSLLASSKESDFERIYSQSKIFEKFAINTLMDNNTVIMGAISADAHSRSINAQKVKLEATMKIRWLQKARENDYGNRKVVLSQPDAKTQQNIIQQLNSCTPNIETCDFYAGQVVLEQMVKVCNEMSAICQTSDEFLQKVSDAISCTTPSETANIEPASKNKLDKMLRVERENMEILVLKDDLFKIYSDAITFIPDCSDNNISPSKILIAQSIIRNLLPYVYSNNVLHSLHKELSKEEISIEIAVLKDMISMPLLSDNSPLKANHDAPNYQIYVTRITSDHLTTTDSAKLFNESLYKLSLLLYPMSRLSVEKCFEIATEEIDKFINNIKKTIEEKNSITLNDFCTITEGAPTLFAVLPKILGKIKEEQNVDVVDPVKMMLTIKLIGDSASDTSNESLKHSCKESLCSFYAQLTLLKSALDLHNKVLDNEKLREEIIKCLIRIVNSINSYSEEQIITSTVELQSLISQKDGKEMITMLADIIPVIQYLRDFAISFFTNGKVIAHQHATELSIKKKAIVTFLGEELPNLFIEIKSVSSYADAAEKIGACIEAINSKEGDLIDVFATIFRALSYVSKAAQLSQSIEFVTEMILSCSSIVESIKSLVEEGLQQISESSLRKTARSFSRTLSSVKCTIENEASNTGAKLSPFNQRKLDILKQLAITTQHVAIIIESRLTQTLLEVFVSRVVKQIGEVDQSFMQVPAKVGAILSLNTRKDIESDIVIASKKVTQCYTVLRTEIQNCPPKEAFIHSWTHCVKTIKAVCELVQKLSDEQCHGPDYASAQSLLPPLEPGLSSSDAESFETIIDYLTICNTQVTNTFNILGDNSSNDEKSNVMNAIYSSVSVFSQHSLLSSTMSTSLKLMEEIEELNNKLITTFNVIRQNFSNAFISNKPINSDEEIKQLKDLITQIINITNEMAKFSVADKPTTAEQKETIKCIQRIQSSLRNGEVKLCNLKQKAADIENEINIRLVALTNSLLRFQAKHIIGLKEKGLLQQVHLDFTDEISQIIPDIQINIIESKNKKDTIMSAVSYILERVIVYRKVCDKQTCETLDGIILDCKALIQYAKEELVSPRIKFQKQAKQKPTKEELRERLNIEAKVTKTRFILKKTKENLANI